MDLDRGRFVDAHHPVIVEVALLHAAFGDRDLVIEGGRKPEDEAALDLRLDAVGIDNRAAIDRGRHAADRNLAIVVDLRLRDRRNVRAEHALAGDAAPDPRGKRASQPAFSAARLRQARSRGSFSRCARRKATGSCPAACTSSSTKLSTTKILCPGPTLRQKQVGTPGGSARTYST